MEPNREVGEKSKREELSPKSLREKRLKVFMPEAVPQPSPVECGICMEEITKHGFSHCKNSHNHKECVKTWIRAAMRNNNARANECATCFQTYNKPQLHEIGLNATEIDTLLGIRQTNPVDTELRRIKTIIDEIIQGRTEHINNLRWGLQQPVPVNDIIHYFAEQNIARLRSLQIRANLVIYVNSQRVRTMNDINKEHTIESIIPNEYAYKNINSVGSYDTSNSTSYERANLLPLDILNNIGVLLLQNKIRGQDHRNKLLEYMNQTVFDIYVELDDMEGIDGYVRPAPCKGSGCNIMGGKKKITKKKRTAKRKTRNIKRT